MKSHSHSLALLACTAAPLRAAVNGNIHPNAIEIDASANLFPSGAPGLVDWVKDSLPNTDAPSLINSVAVGLIPNRGGCDPEWRRHHRA